MVDDKKDKKEDDSNNSNKFLLFSVAPRLRYSLLTLFCGYCTCMAFFVSLSSLSILIMRCIFTLIDIYIFINHPNYFLPCILYCNDGKNKQDSSESNSAAEKSLKKDSEDYKKDSEDSKNDSSEDDSLEDETLQDPADKLSRLEGEHIRISKDILDLKKELVDVDKSEKLDQKLPESAKDKNSYANNLKKSYSDWSNEDIRRYVKSEIERLTEDKEYYESRIREAIYDKKYYESSIREEAIDDKNAKADTMKVDNPTGNKREASSSSTEDSNSPKRHKSSKNDNDDNDGKGGGGGGSAFGGSGSGGNAEGGDSSIASGSNKERIGIGEISAGIGGVLGNIGDVLGNGIFFSSLTFVKIICLPFFFSQLLLRILSWYYLLTFCIPCMTFFICVCILLRFLINLCTIMKIAAVYNIKLWFNDICFNLSCYINNHSPLPSGLPYIVICTGESEGKNKRKASIEDNESGGANKNFVPGGGIAEVNANTNSNSNQNHSLKKLQEVKGQMNDTVKELDSVKKDLKDVRQTINIDDHLSEDQKQKNNALQEIKQKYPTFFDEDSGNATDREGLDQVKEYLEEDLASLQKKHSSLSIQSRKYQSILD